MYEIISIFKCILCLKHFSFSRVRQSGRVRQELESGKDELGSGSCRTLPPSNDATDIETRGGAGDDGRDVWREGEMGVESDPQDARLAI